METQTATATQCERAALRANAFFTLARAFDQPEAWPEGVADLLREHFAATDADTAAQAAALAEAVEADADREAITRSYAALFIGPFTIAAAPWATYYLDPEQKLLGPVSEYAANAYVEAGLAPSEERNESPDHVAHELEFMYFLGFEEASGGDPVWLERQQRFWREHLGRWLPQLAAVIEKEAGESVYYARLAKLTAAFCGWIDSELGSPDAAPVKSGAQH
jgi:TorA maturation chaperone TorD